MARIRTVKPEFWDDEKMAAIPRDARLLFIALWNFSDDYGVVKGHPSWLKNKIFPYDDIKQATFNEWLLSIEKIRAIVSFDHNGEKYYYIRTFKDHQKIDRPSVTRNPEAPADILESNRSLFDEGSASVQRGLVAVREGKVREGKVREGKYSEDFISFWEEYPKRVGKDEAWKAWQKRNGDRPELQVLLSVIEKQKGSDQWTKDNGKFIPHPATWINGGRWADELIQAEKEHYE